MNRVLHWRGHAWISLLLRLYLGGVFLLACIHKIADPAEFAKDVAVYQLVPLALVNGFALILPWTELLAGTFLVLGIRVKAASLLVALMMISFIIALSWALHLRLDISCGCFASSTFEEATRTDPASPQWLALLGVASDPISWHTLLRDSIWLAMALYVFSLDHRPLGLERIARKRRVSNA